MEVASVCVSCKEQNTHEVNHNGQATVTCPKCQMVYRVQTYQIRAKGDRRDRSGWKHYLVRVNEPDKDETLLQFRSRHEIEMRSGDWLTESYDDKGLRYLWSHTFGTFWQIQRRNYQLITLTIFLAILASGLVILWKLRRFLGG